MRPLPKRLSQYETPPVNPPPIGQELHLGGLIKPLVQYPAEGRKIALLAGDKSGQVLKSQCVSFEAPHMQACALSMRRIGA